MTRLVAAVVSVLAVVVVAGGCTEQRQRLHEDPALCESDHRTRVWLEDDQYTVVPVRRDIGGTRLGAAHEVCGDRVWLIAQIPRVPRSVAFFIRDYDGHRHAVAYRPVDRRTRQVRALLRKAGLCRAATGGCRP